MNTQLVFVPTVKAGVADEATGCQRLNSLLLIPLLFQAGKALNCVMVSPQRENALHTPPSARSQAPCIF